MLITFIRGLLCMNLQVCGRPNQGELGSEEAGSSSSRDVALPAQKYLKHHQALKSQSPPPLSGEGNDCDRARP